MAAMAEHEVTRFTDPHDDGSGVDEEPYREWLRTRKDQTDRLDLAIVSKATGRTVGEAVLNKWSPEDESCNFRIMIGADGRGRGFGTEATRLIVGHGFEQLGLHRISLTVYAFNPRARRVYEKAGFVEEGRERQAVRLDGERYDDIMMSILAPEWEALRSKGDQS
jgi:RimJ/RimL family protein N-acetyltransferase